MCDFNRNLNSLVGRKKIQDDDINANKMLRALSAIALEMQIFHAGSPLSCHNFGESLELNDKLRICKSNLRLKRKQIKILKENLRKACIVAKTVMSAKENATMSLNNYINSTRSDYIEIYNKNRSTTENIQYLVSDNEALNEKIKYLEEFIDLGYQELQKMRNRTIEKLPTVMKLKEIMVSCGQYYADYSNELNACTQLEQRNRFLNTRIKILANNLEGIAEELKNLRHQNTRLMKENASLKIKHMKQHIEHKSVTKVRCNESENVLLKHMETGIMAGDHKRIFDFTSHLSLVQELLSSQDHMLNDLKKLSEKLSIESTDTTSELS